MDKDTGFTFKATVTVKPEVKVGKYKGIAATKIIHKVEDGEVEAEITRLQERGARILTAEDREARMGDIVLVDFEGFVGGAAFEGGKGEDFELELGSHTFIDTFEEQIAGHRVGDEFDANVTFPQDYHAQDLAGKPALFKIKLKEIKEKQLPELDDEFAKDVSEFDTMEELRADLRAKMQQAKDRTSQDQLENALVDEIIQSVEGDIPEVMYENKVGELVRDFEQRISQQGMNMDLYLQYTGMDMEAFRKSFRAQAERQVKIRLALEAVAREEKLEVAQEDIAKEYNRLAEEYKIEAEQLKGILSEKDIIADLRCNRAIDLVRDHAEVTEEVHDHSHDHADEEAGEEKAAPKKKAASKSGAKAAKAPAKKAAPKDAGQPEGE